MGTFLSKTLKSSTCEPRPDIHCFLLLVIVVFCLDRDGISTCYYLDVTWTGTSKISSERNNRLLWYASTAENISYNHFVLVLSHGTFNSFVLRWYFFYIPTYIKPCCHVYGLSVSRIKFYQFYIFLQVLHLHMLYIILIRYIQLISVALICVLFDNKTIILYLSAGYLFCCIYSITRD